MKSSSARWKEIAAALRSTPLHPQWLCRDPRMQLPEARNLPQAGYLLDIGAGDGWLRHRLPSGWCYVAFDHPEVGRSWYGARPDVCGDAVSLPFGDASFDAVALLEVVEHLERFDVALSEVNRVLKPGGVVLCSMPFLYPVHDAPRDFQRLTIHGLQYAASRFGWKTQSSRRVSPGFHCLAVQFGVGLSSIIIAPPGRGVIRRLVSFALLPLIPIVNVVCALLSALLPAPDGLAGGHVMVFSKADRCFAAPTDGP